METITLILIRFCKVSGEFIITNLITHSGGTLCMDVTLMTFLKFAQCDHPPFIWCKNNWDTNLTTLYFSSFNNIKHCCVICSGHYFNALSPGRYGCNVELTLNVRGPSYLGLTRPISWLLMPWLLTSPEHQQPWYWLCRIGRFLSYLRKDFNYLRRTIMEKWHKM